LEIAVVDDEKAIREHICALIEEQKPGSHIEAYATGGELLASGKRFDIVFLDIQMDGMNGIEAARKLRERQEDTVLIFITGIKEYVFDAFDVGAFHYLLKPIEEKKFTEVLENAVKEAEKKNQQELFVIKTRNRNIAVRKNQILFVESRMRKAKIHTIKEDYEIYGTMNDLEKQLGKNFYRCHRGYLVNLAHVSEYTSDSIRLTDSTVIYLSREKHNEFVKTYMMYLHGGGISYV